jgi:single-strand DNA-binding protein
MSNLANKVQLIGNLGQDPAIVTFDNGKKLAKFSIATSESYTNKHGEKVNNTQWHNIVAWNKTAEIIEKYVTKGNRIGLDGKLTSRVYTDNDGVKRYVTEIVCANILMLGSRL